MTCDNCMVCSEEFHVNDLKSVVLSNKTISKFKICQACLKISDPKNDYLEVKKIVDSYLKFEDIIKL